MEVTQRVSLGKQGNVIVVSHLQFDEDGFGTGQRNAIIPIDAGRSPLEMIEKAAKNAWRITGMPNLGGFYEAEKIRPLTEEELRTSTGLKGRSITVKVQLTDAEVASEDLVHGALNTPSNQPMPLVR